MNIGQINSDMNNQEENKILEELLKRAKTLYNELQNSPISDEEYEKFEEDCKTFEEKFKQLDQFVAQIMQDDYDILQDYLVKISSMQSEWKKQQQNSDDNQNQQQNTATNLQQPVNTQQQYNTPNQQQPIDPMQQQLFMMQMMQQMQQQMQQQSEQHRIEMEYYRQQLENMRNERAQKEAEEQAQRDAEEQAQRDAEEQARRDAEQAQRDAEQAQREKAEKDHISNSQKTEEQNGTNFAKKIESLASNTNISVSNLAIEAKKETINWYVADYNSEIYRLLEKINMSELGIKGKDIQKIFELSYKREVVIDLLNDLSKIPLSHTTKKLFKQLQKDVTNKDLRKKFVVEVTKSVANYIDKKVVKKVPKTASKFSTDKREEFLGLLRNKKANIIGLTGTEIFEATNNFDYGIKK